MARGVDMFDDPILISIRIEKDDGISVSVSPVLNPPDDLRIIRVGNIGNDDSDCHRLFHQKALGQGIRAVVQVPDSPQNLLPGCRIDLVGAVVDDPGDRGNGDFGYLGNIQYG